MKLYKIEGYVAYKIFNSDETLGAVRDRNYTDDFELRIVADDLEEAIEKFKRQAAERYNKNDCDDWGDYTQLVTKITVQNASTIMVVDVL